MDRTELDQLDRDALIARAETLGVPRARILTRPELIDEIVTAAARGSAIPPSRGARGFFGRARDLLARVVERGLHLPDAADRIRAAVFEPPPVRVPPDALPTVTLAEIYAAQGHRERARETLASVLAREPEHATARALLAKLDRAGEMPSRPPLPPEEETIVPPPIPPEELVAAEHAAAARWEPRRADACVAIRTEGTTFFVYWHVRVETLDHVRRAQPDARLALRVLVIVPTWDGPSSTARDLDIDVATGDARLADLPEGAVVRVAVGLKGASGFFPVAHSPALELAPDVAWPAPATALVRWTTRGPERVTVDDSDAPMIAHAIAQARARALLGTA